MVAKTAFVAWVCGLGAVALVACAGPVGGKGEGEACNTEDECGGNLTCQPVVGRNADYCCPTQGPGAPASKEANCQPATTTTH